VDVQIPVSLTDVGINCDWIRGRNQGLLEKHVVEIPPVGPLRANIL